MGNRQSQSQNALSSNSDVGSNKDGIDSDNRMDNRGSETVLSASATCPDAAAMVFALVSEADYEEMDNDYAVLSLSEIVASMNKEIREAAQLTNLRNTLVRILLNHVRWDQDAFTDRFFGDDLAGFFEAAGAVMPEEYLEDAAENDSSESEIDVVASTSTSEMAVLAPKRTASKSAEVSASRSKKSRLDLLSECGICMMPIESPDSMAENGCGHVFCVSCWREYLTVKVKDEGMASFIQCPTYQCKILLEDDFVCQLIHDLPEILERYERRITSEFVECHRRMKWCPGPECSKAIKTSLVSHGRVRCECGFEFCFCCGGDVHDPVSCEHIKIWLKKVDKDNGTANWLSKNTKECPRCSTTIEKNGGCNHMICRQQSCRYHFCWVCLGPWEPHGQMWFKCNRFEMAEGRSARDDLEKKRFEMERFLFFSNRYENHINSLKLEDKLSQKVDEVLGALCDQAILTRAEFPAVKKAVQYLHRCRRTLAYTYAFAYALRKNNQVLIFEDNQKDLEMATENLSDILERRFQVDCAETDIKLQIINQSQYCESRRKILMNHVREGEINATWEFYPIVNGAFVTIDAAEPNVASGS